MTHIMLDIETLATTPDAVILEIAATTFDGAHEFEARINPREQERTIDPGTVAWWVTQPHFAEAMGGDTDLAHALYRITGFFGKFDAPLVWANSPAFDCVILRHAFDQYGYKCPWSYRDERDVRTLLALTPERIGRQPDGEARRALNDARHQVRAVMAAAAALGVEL